MKMIISDLDENDSKKILPNPSDDLVIISDDKTIHNCVGCFGCWVKTPAACVIRDNYGDMGELLSKCHKLIVISKCYYGSFSPFVKAVLDRSISYVHPYFVIKNGEMHHRRRYKNDIKAEYWFYGEDITEKEKTTAKKLIKANSKNYYCEVSHVSFCKSSNELEGKIL